MLLQPLPTGTTHSLSNDGLEFLPSFVRARLNYLADMLDWREDEGDDEDDDEDDDEEYEEGEETLFTYHEVRGKLSNGHYSAREGVYIAPIHFWIASDDNCHRSLYIGGVSWICPDSHSLFFDSIDPTLFVELPDPNVWWCIQYEEGIKVIKIHICPSEEITEDFPHGV